MKSVAVFYHSEDSCWWADSPDVPGWTCVGQTLEAVRKLAAEGLREFCGVDTMISEVLPRLTSSSGVGRIFVEATKAADQPMLWFSVAQAPIDRTTPLFAPAVPWPDAYESSETD